MLTGGPPTPLRHEVARPHLVERLSRRWSVPVTTVVAGAGFGKSTLLAQALRAEAVAPSGIDAFVGCRVGQERAVDLAAAIITAIDGVPGRDPVLATLASFHRHAPLDVCVVLDDVHLLGGESSAISYLAALIRRLPANGHLVLAGRCPPPVPLARMRANDQLVEITQDDLAFTPAEVGRLAADLGRDPRQANGYGGWPALVRVALAVRRDVAAGFAREEVLAELDVADRRALFVLTVTGAATDDDVARVLDEPVDLAALAARVPMIARCDDAAFRAHELWLDVLPPVLGASEVGSLRRRVVGELLSRGEIVRAGEAALAGGCRAALDAVALALVRSTISVLPVEAATRWFGAVPTAELAVDRRPGLCLLQAATWAARDAADARVDPALDEIVATACTNGDSSIAVAALAVGTVAAQSRGDTARLMVLAARTAGVPGGQDDPIVRLAAATIAAVVAEMSGDPEGAIDALGAAPLDGVPPALAVSTRRFLMHCLLLAGRADEAAAVADTLAETATGLAAQMPAFARWLAGDPSGFAEPPTVDPAATSARDAFVARAFHAVIRASWGDREPFDVIDADNGRDAAVVANARAAHAVLDHDEEAALKVLAEVGRRFPGDVTGERHLRRFLALGYILDDDLRARWDAAPLGPSHARARAVAQALRILRAGGAPPAAALDPAIVFTVLPLPWSVELACRLHGSGSPQGARLTSWLLDRVGCAVHRELRTAAAAADLRLARDATALLARLPARPTTALTISVLGALEVRHDGVAAGGEMRRARVRELLCTLVLEPCVSRDRVIDALWPDLDVESGSRNLRVTLTHLHRLLEPSRPPGEAPFHVRADASTIRLVASPHLTVDVWELRRLAAAAADARDAGDVAAAIAHLGAAVALHRGAPLIDLDRVAGFDAQVQAIRLLEVSCLLDLGTLQLTTGDAGAALTCAERVLALEPYLEAAHRLAIAAAGQRRDAPRAAAAVARARRALDELGVTPEPATEMLMRAAARRLTPVGERLAG